MAELDSIIQITIDRTTQSPTRAGFGTFGIMAEFASGKTTATFTRARTYATLQEMLDDGWATTDDVYKMASKVFSQSPKLSKVLVGRKDAGDADWATALGEIQKETDDWYMFSLNASRLVKFVYDADFVTSNNIDVTINGIAVTTVPFNTNQATTMADLISQIETDVAGSDAYLDTGDATNRTLIVEVFGEGGVDSASSVVTGGASQATAAISYVNDDDYKAVATWVATQKKVFIYSSGDAGIKDALSTTDVAYVIKATNNERVIQCYHPNSQGGASADEEYMEAAWPGEALPYDSGSQTWAFKTLIGVISYGLLSSEKSAVQGKNCNTYMNIGGIDITEEGKVASGEWIDIIRGQDELEARLQEEIYTELINSRKIPFTDEGGTVLEGAIKSVLYDFASRGFLVAESIVVSVPLVADISATDKNNRNFTGITFSADLQGAVHKVTIQGTLV